MSVRIKYAYLKQQTWLYRRNYPKELQGVLGQAMKQSLKTSDARIAKARVAEVDAKYEEVIAKARAGYVVEKPKPIVVAPAVFSPVVLVGRRTVKDLAHTYLERRSRELQRGGFKSVRFSVGLFVSAYGSRQIGTVTRDDALAFVRKVALLGCHTGSAVIQGSHGGPVGMAWTSLSRLVKATAYRPLHRGEQSVRSAIFWTGRYTKGSWSLTLSKPCGSRLKARAEATQR